MVCTMSEFDTFFSEFQERPFFPLSNSCTSHVLTYFLSHICILYAQQSSNSRQAGFNTFLLLNSAIKPEQNSWLSYLGTLRSEEPAVSQRRIPEFDACLKQQWVYHLFPCRLPPVWNPRIPKCGREHCSERSRRSLDGGGWKRILILRGRGRNPLTSFLSFLLIHPLVIKKFHGADGRDHGSDSS